MCFWRSCLCRAGVNNIVVILMKCHVITKGKMSIMHWKYLFQFACFVQKRNIKEEYASSNFKISFIAASYNQPYNIETQSPTRKEQFLSTGYLIFVPRVRQIVTSVDVVFDEFGLLVGFVAMFEFAIAAV